jgi:hypothetical protein
MANESLSFTNVLGQFLEGHLWNSQRVKRHGGPRHEKIASASSVGGLDTHPGPAAPGISAV